MAFICKDKCQLQQLKQYIIKIKNMDASNTFKYVLYPGNNPSVIQEALTKRKVWSQIPVQKILNANFIWKPLNFPSTLYQNFNEIMRYDKSRNVLMNHFENNTMICTKSGLVRSLKHYYSHQNSIYQQNYHVFQTIPTTFIVYPNKGSPQLKDFLERFAELEDKNFTKEKVPQKHCEKNIWYIKPEALNQGRGISLTNNLKQIQSIIFAKSTNTAYIIQKAIEKPLLYQKRKFDIRVWALVTGNMEIYFYKTPYIRTSSYEYNDTDFDQYIHLTNNCQQKYFSEYSKFEQGNTIPYECLKEVLTQMGKSDVDQLSNKILQRMKALVIDCFLSVRKFFLRNVKKKQFQLFGFDFLIDQDLRTWLLEVNNNPYLGIPNKFIKQLLPQMINQMFEIVLDPIFPPIDYKGVENRNYQLLHKQVSFYRINPVRSGSTDNKRKDYYPMQQFSINQSKDVITPQKSRRNSEAVNTFQNTQKNIKIRYSTPSQSIRYLLDTYCFNDLEPFIVPVNFILSSPKLEQKQYLDSNIKNIKLISDTRICHILLEQKFVLICKKIIQSQKVAQEIKVCILNGFSNAIRNYKNRVSIIKNIVPSLNEIMRIHNRKLNEPTLIIQDPLIEAIILLLIRLGAVLNRKIFIPGESRQKEISRQFFITSNTLKMLLLYKESYPELCKKELQQFMGNLNDKDWQLFNSVEKGEQNIGESLPPSRNNVEQGEKNQKLGIVLNPIDEKQRRISYRQRFEAQQLKNIAKLPSNTSTLPKIKK